MGTADGRAKMRKRGRRSSERHVPSAACNKVGLAEMTCSRNSRLPTATSCRRLLMDDWSKPQLNDVTLVPMSDTE